MTERDAFIEAIAANPGDDTARLAFADWLQERGEDARAEFIRLQCVIARRKAPSDESNEDFYHYPLQNPDLEEARSLALLTDHWHEWFGPVLGAVGMPLPGAPSAPVKDQGYLRYPPYALGSHWGPLSRHLPIVFERELNPRSNRSRRPQRFLSSLRLDRGFATGLTANLASAGPRCSLAAALRLEPVTTLALQIPPEGSDRWAALAHRSLARVRDLELTVEGANERPDFTQATGAILSSPVLPGVRRLALLVRWEYDDQEAPAPLSRTEAEAVLASPVARGLHALRVGVEPDGATAFATAEPLPDLRALSLRCFDPRGAPVPLPLPAYRDRLERLDLSGNFDTVALGGRPWARLTDLRLDSAHTGNVGLDGLLAPGLFPALSRLRIASTSAPHAHALAGAIRAGRFPNLAAVAMGGQLAGSLAALAEAVAPTTIRELDLRQVWDHTDAEYEHVRELLGDRVRIVPPADPNEIPF